MGGPNEWTAEDRAKVLARTIEKRLQCPECGTRRDEWDPKRGGHRQAYTAISDMCHGCRISGEAYSGATKDNPNIHGIKVHLEPTVNHPQYRPSLKPKKVNPSR